MKCFALSSLIFMFVSCFGNKNESGVLKINAPEGSTLKDEVMKNGVHFYSIKWKLKNEMTSVFSISKWPVEMPTSEMAPSVQKIAEDTFAATKAKGKSKIEDDAKIQYSEISEKFVSGNVGYFEHNIKRGNQRIDRRASCRERV